MPETGSSGMLAAARYLVSCGLAAVAIAPETKRPWHKWKPLQERLPADAELVEYFSRAGCWVGFVCGEGSGGVEALDFDVPGKAELAEGELGTSPAYDPWRDMMRELGAGDLLDRLVIARSRSGGIHVYYRAPSIDASRKIATRPGPNGTRDVLIETRGHGGLVVCAPSPGYTILQGDLAALPELTVEEHHQILSAAEYFDETPFEPPKSPSRPGSASASVGGRAGDDFDARATWEEILVLHGWCWTGRLQGRYDLWARPGKDSRKGHSARTGEGTLGDRFYCWSSSAGVPAGSPLTKFALYAFLRFGDAADRFTLAARELGAKGYGPATTPSVVPSSSPLPPRRDTGAPEQQLEMIDGEAGLIPEDEAEDPYPWTDVGNARRFVARYPGRLRYCSDWGRWLTWTGSHWREDAPENPSARCLAHSLADDLYSRHRTLKLGSKLQEGKRISAMLREAQVLPGVSTRQDELDQHDMLLAAPNGVINLETGDLLAPDPDLLITKAINVPYDPTAQCPAFMTFLMQITKERKDLVDLLVRALGYTLTGSTKEQKFFILYGPRARNGKSTLMDLMQQLLGHDLASTIRKKLLTDADADSNRFARGSIEGRRMICADEAKKGTRLDVEFLKEFAGGKRMQVERKGKQEYSFQVHAKLWYAVNNLPSVDFDPAFKDRIVPIPFDQSFYSPDNENWQEGDLPPDRDLPEKLSAELPGILALLVQGCLRWQRQGGLILPSEVVAVRRTYEADNDHVATWIGERCFLSPAARSRTMDLFKDFREYAKDAGLRGGPNKIGDFATRLEREPGLAWIKPGNVSTFTGIELRRIEQPALSEGE